MPVKRRINKNRSFDDQKLEDMFYGPGTCLFNGEGYLGPHGDGFWRDKSQNVQAAVLEEMRTDWAIHRRAILKAWAERDKRELWFAERHHQNPAQPWAQREFETAGG